MLRYKFEHIGLTVSDINESIRWYEDNFGFKETKRFNKPDLELEVAIIELENLHLELLQPSYSPKQKLKPPLYTIGSSHLALSVDDINTAYEKLKRNKVKSLTELIDSRYFFCKDPNGILIEIRQKK